MSGRESSLSDRSERLSRTRRKERLFFITAAGHSGDGVKQSRRHSCQLFQPAAASAQLSRWNDEFRLIGVWSSPLLSNSCNWSVGGQEETAGMMNTSAVAFTPLGFGESVP